MGFDTRGSVQTMPPSPAPTKHEISIPSASKFRVYFFKLITLVVTLKGYRNTLETAVANGVLNIAEELRSKTT